MEPNPTIQMLDQLWRVVSMALISGFCYAAGAAPVLYGLLQVTKGRK
jgi:hypothetical protein